MTRTTFNKHLRKHYPITGEVCVFCARLHPVIYKALVKHSLNSKIADNELSMSMSDITNEALAKELKVEIEKEK